MKRLDLATLSVRFFRIWSVLLKECAAHRPQQPGPESAGPVQGSKAAECRYPTRLKARIGALCAHLRPLSARQRILDHLTYWNPSASMRADAPEHRRATLCSSGGN